MNIIIKPLLTEKTLRLASQHLYTFLVDPSASKHQVKFALEQMYPVHVTRINISKRHVSARRTGSKRILGASSTRKVAVLQLKSGESLDLFEIKG